MRRCGVLYLFLTSGDREPGKGSKLASIQPRVLSRVMNQLKDVSQSWKMCNANVREIVHVLLETLNILSLQ